MTDDKTQRKTTRRRFLRGAAVGAAGATLVGCAGGEPADGSGPAVHTNKHLTWRLASSFPRSLDTLFGCAETLSECLETMSGGRFRLRQHRPSRSRQACGHQFKAELRCRYLGFRRSELES